MFRSSLQYMKTTSSPTAGTKFKEHKKKYFTSSNNNTLFGDFQTDLQGTGPIVFLNYCFFPT